MKFNDLKKSLLQRTYQDELILVSLTTGVLINIILWIILLIKFGFDRDMIPLHFSVVYGINFVGPATGVYQIPLVGLTVIILNWFLVSLVYERQKLMSYFLTFTASLVQILLFLAGLSLVFLNR